MIPRDPASRAAALSLISNAVLMVFKLTIGILSGSVAVLSDGIDSAQDMVAAAISFASVSIARRPPDIGHPYGHGRTETLAAAAQAVLIGGGGVYIIFRAIDRFISPPDHIHTEIGILIMLITLVANLGVARYAGGVARLTHSPAIESEARHSMSNVVQAGGVLAGLVLVNLTGRIFFDPLVALGIAVYLLWTALRILWSVVRDTLDVSLPEGEIGLIEKAILSEGKAIAGYHRLRTRRSGQQPQIDFHLILPGGMALEEAHTIADRIEARIREHWPTAAILIHSEPDDGRFLGPGQSEVASHGREGEAGGDGSGGKRRL